MTGVEVVAEIRGLYADARRGVYGAAGFDDDAESAAEAYGRGLMDAYAECLALLEGLEVWS